MLQDGFTLRIRIIIWYVSYTSIRVFFEIILWGAWLALLAEHVTLDLGVVSLSPTLGVEIT